jgi:adenosylcobinamide amidohydrolase
VEARTLAVREGGVPSRRSGAPTSGTGTDCLVLAWRTAGAAPLLPYAGKHTAAGHVVGRAVGEAVAAGVAAWLVENGAPAWPG